MVRTHVLLAWACLRNIFLGLELLVHLLAICWDTLVAALRGSPILPDCTLRGVRSPAVLSVLLRRRVAAVELVRTSPVVSSLSATQVMSGDAACGTDRAWLRLTYADAPDEPDNVFIKLPTSMNWMRVVLTWTSLYRNELYFYRKIAPLLPDGIACPARAVVHSGTRFALVLEDLSAPRAGVSHRLLNLTEHCSLQEARAVLDTLARLHALFWGEAAAYTVWTESLRPPWRPVLLASGLAMFKRQYPDLLRKDVEACYADFVWHYARVRRWWDTSSPRCLVHGDAHLGNVFLRFEGGGVSAGLYDWQVVSCESPMRDVTYFIQMSLAPAVLAAEGVERGLVEYYLGALRRELGARGLSAEAGQLTADWAWRQHRAHTLYAIMACVLTTGAANFVESRDVARALIERAHAAFDRVGARAMLDEIVGGAKD